MAWGCHTKHIYVHNSCLFGFWGVRPRHIPRRCCGTGPLGACFCDHSVHLAIDSSCVLPDPCNIAGQSGTQSCNMLHACCNSCRYWYWQPGHRPTHVENAPVVFSLWCFHIYPQRSHAFLDTNEKNEAPPLKQCTVPLIYIYMYML